VKQHEAVIDARAGGAQRVNEVDLAAAVGGQVLDEQDARAFFQLPLDLRIAAEALRLFAHVLHRHHHAVGDPRGEGNAGRFTAGHGVDLLVADIAQDRRFGHFHECAAHARVGNQLAAVDVHGAGPPRGEDERLFGVEMHGLHFEQNLGGRIGDRLAIEACHGRILG
jgi:hypothetical protein